MTQISYQLGGVFLLATLILVLSFCRDLFSHELRDAIKKVGMLGIAALLAYAGIQTYWPSSGAALHAVSSDSQASRPRPQIKHRHLNPRSGAASQPHVRPK
jgi:hypothetical protein